MVEGFRNRSSLEGVIFERDPTNEPSMQMESMADLDGIDLIGAAPEQAALDFSNNYGVRRRDA